MSDPGHELPFPAKILTLDRNLTLIHQHLPATPVVVADVWVQAGVVAEPPSWSGLAHFLEHMIFKGSKRIFPGEFDRVIEHCGSVANAATSHDYAHYFLTTAQEHLDHTLPYLGEILLQAAIPDGEFYRERDVVLEEIRSCYDDPDYLGFQALCQLLYQHHPYGRSILGEADVLLNHTPHQMRCFHQTHYQPERTTVVMVGNVPEDRAIALVEKSFADFAVRSECPPVAITPEAPLETIRRAEVYLPEMAHGRLCLGWLTPGVADLESAFGLDLLSIVLASGQTSRLVRDLREEKQWVLDICCAFSLQRDSSLFTINVWLDPPQMEAVEQVIREHLIRLQREPISAIELQRCKTLLQNDYIFSTETPGQLAGLYGYYHAIGHAQDCLRYPQAIAGFSAADLQRLACRYLSPDRYAISVLKPC